MARSNQIIIIDDNNYKLVKNYVTRGYLGISVNETTILNNICQDHNNTKVHIIKII